MVLSAITRRNLLAVLSIASLGAACSARTGAGEASGARANLYHCEGCEGALERDADTLGWQATMASPSEPGERMRIEGIILNSDGRTPAAGVVVYAHHTNANGLYANGSAESEWSQRHGRLRAWVRTDADGRYAFNTIKPAPYPDMTMPAHVHLVVAEPGRRAYYIDDIVFDGEFGVTPSYRDQQELRGGSGITKLVRAATGQWLARRNITLERHPA
ncbi:hypothetical protein [uncultured Erythrobacter sp.]|uniref:dioxygenase family protein n=1 Tax=uncultured Erythrobacter sp. TaxID=263913 RepID=UPI0037490403